MRKIDSKNIIRYEDAEMSIEQYISTDSNNNDIVIRIPNPERHTPHDIYNDPAIHQNVGFAIRNYDIKKSGSNSVASISDNTGVRIVYECNDFYRKINHPNQHTKPNYKLIAVVHYGFDGDNYTNTYYDQPGGI